MSYHHRHWYHLAKKKLRWVAHVGRMDENKPSKEVLYGQLPKWKRSVGRQFLRYKDKLKDNLKRLNFELETWEDQASNRKEWRETCFLKLKGLEDSWLKQHDQLQALNKKRHQNPALTNFLCRCGFLTSGKAEQVSRSRKHKRYVFLSPDFLHNHPW